MRSLIFAAVLCCATAASGQPRAVITDPNGNPLPESMPLGEAVYFSARQATHAGKAGSARWIVKPQARAARSREYDDGLELCVPTGTAPVVLTVQLVVTLEDVIDVAEIEVRLGDEKPAPRPDVPRPIPDPVTPRPEPGEFGLVLASFEGRKAAGGSSEEAAAIARAHREEAALARKNAFAVVVDMQAAVANRIKASLPDDARKRWSAWQAAVAQRVLTLEREGRLSNRPQWIQAFEEIASGLEAR